MQRFFIDMLKWANSETASIRWELSYSLGQTVSVGRRKKNTEICHYLANCWSSRRNPRHCGDTTKTRTHYSVDKATLLIDDWEFVGMQFNQIAWRKSTDKFKFRIRSNYKLSAHNWLWSKCVFLSQKLYSSTATKLTQFLTFPSKWLHFVCACAFFRSLSILCLILLNNSHHLQKLFFPIQIWFSSNWSFKCKSKLFCGYCWHFSLFSLCGAGSVINSQIYGYWIWRSINKDTPISNVLQEYNEKKKPNKLKLNPEIAHEINLPSYKFW